jgi:subfamily B ATP-binding cassette protein MsbA
MKMIATKSASVPVIQVIASFALAFVFYAITSDTLRETITPGTFTSIIAYMVMLLRPLKMLTNVNAEFQQGMAACVSVFSILDHEKEKDSGTIALNKASGHLSFQHVDFTYKTHDESSNKEQSLKLALSDLSFNLAPGERLHS